MTDKIVYGVAICTDLWTAQQNLDFIDNFFLMLINCIGITKIEFEHQKE